MKYFIVLFTAFLFLLSADAQILPRLMIESGDDMYAGNEDILFSKNNRYLALTSDRVIRIYDLRTGFLIKKIQGEDNYSWVRFSSDFRYFSYTRLQNFAEPTDKEAFQQLQQTFSDSLMAKRHYNKDDQYKTYLLPLNTRSAISTHDTLLFLPKHQSKSDTSRLVTSKWCLNATQDKILVAAANDCRIYYLLGLERLDTLQIIDFRKLTAAASLSAVRRKQQPEDNYYYCFTHYIYFNENDRYIVLNSDAGPRL